MRPFAPRRREFRGVERRGGWALKRYAISFDGPLPAPADFAAGTEQAWAALPPEPRAPGRAGAGLLIEHRGRGADYVVLAWWDRENELPIRVFVRADGGAWRPARGAESVCVWDLEIVAFERDAYVDTVLREGRAEDVEGYLARTMPAATGAVPFDDLWDFDDPAGTEARFRDLERSLEHGGDEGSLLALRTQIARTRGLQRRFDEAHTILDGVAARLDAAAPGVRVRYLLERGRVLNSSGRRGEAKAVFVEAWDAARAAGEDAFAVDAAHMVAIVESPEEAVRWNEVGLELARESPDPRARRWRASLLNNLGWTWHGRGDFARAHGLFEEALAARREGGKPAEIDVARWCVARALRSLGRVAEALEGQRALLRDLETSGRPADGYVHEEIAECLLALADSEGARRHFAKAAELLARDPWLAEREPERIARLARLGGAGA
jgi:tetratricopeptide (TPR) repeat protein